MKYYETLFEEYYSSVNNCNFHKYLEERLSKLDINNLKHSILYGPSGIGKYSQAINIIKKIYNNPLTYTKVTIKNEKNTYHFRISDIHYEIDMSLLGCHSKTMFYDIMNQCIEIITTNPNRFGIIVCKNFHDINHELLEIFHSYMKNNEKCVIIRFMILTDSISFLPNNILSSCEIYNLSRPILSKYTTKINKNITDATVTNNVHNFTQRISRTQTNYENVEMFKRIKPTDIVNLKELNYVALSKSIPPDIFNIVCDKLIETMIMKDIDKKILKLRNEIYDLFSYNINIGECIWYILDYLLTNDLIKDNTIPSIMSHCSKYMHFLNNNYRAIYHIENVLLHISSKIVDI
jgi:DNA polymerase III delta prime subunit